MYDDDERTLYVGNLSEKVSEDMIYELFLQAGPIDYVKLPLDKTRGVSRGFAFVCYRHGCSVSYAVYLLSDCKLFGKYLNLQSKSRDPLLPTEYVGMQTLDPVMQNHGVNQNHNHPQNYTDSHQNYPNALQNFAAPPLINHLPSLMGMPPPLMAQQMMMSQLNNQLNNSWQPPNLFDNSHSGPNMVSRFDNQDNRNDRSYNNYPREHRNDRNSYKDRDNFHHRHQSNSPYGNKERSRGCNDSYDRSYRDRDRHHDRPRNDRHDNHNRRRNDRRRNDRYNEYDNPRVHDRLNYRRN